MKLFESVCRFDYPWHQVSAAHWRKYPNESAVHVIAVDTLRREIGPDGVLRTERLITVRQGVPTWVKKVIGCLEDSYVRELSEVDLNTKELKYEGNNIRD